MDIVEAARRWARTWEDGWPAGAAGAIAALYRNDAVHRSSALGEPQAGGAAGYLQRQFALEQDVECRFGAPMTAGDRAGVEWWASWVEDGDTLTLAGVTVLRFDGDGQVSEHVDYWVHEPGRRPPYQGWGR